MILAKQRVTSRKKAFFWLVVVAACLFALLVRLSREPTYEGKGLRDWVRQYDDNYRQGQGDLALRQAAEVAIQHIGTDAVPYLIEQARVRDFLWGAKLRQAIPKTWYDRLRLNPGIIRRRGAHGLAALGTNAAAALPELIEIGRTHPEEDGRYIAVWTVGKLGSAAEPAIPFLIECLTNQSDIIRWDAAYGLGYIRRRADLAVPALVRYLELAKESENVFDFHSGIQSLRAFGPQAKDAVPVLLSLVNQSADIGNRVTNALIWIVPEKEDRTDSGRP